MRDTYSPRSTPRRALLAIGSIVALMLASIFTASSAGASEGCGEISADFTGTRLLNDGISDSAGPFPFALPAGTYTVTLVAQDNHDTQVGVDTQPLESYVVVLDSGYVSPPSIDIADDETMTTTVFENQVVAADATTITVRHAGGDNINSVNPLCVGFDPIIEVEVLGEQEERPDANEDSTGENTIENDATPGDSPEGEHDAGDSSDAPIEPVEPVDEGASDETAQPDDINNGVPTVSDESDANSDVQDEPVQGIGEPAEVVVADEPADVGSASGGDETQPTVVGETDVDDTDGETTTTAPPETTVQESDNSAPPTSIEVEVLGEVERATQVSPTQTTDSAAGELALTGSYNAITFTGVALGLVLVGLSMLLYANEQRRSA